MTVEYLRISITDKCNLRCIYCNPLGEAGFLDPREILSYEEICRLAALFVEGGVRKIRITGGEPLVRKDVTCLIRRLSGLDGVNDLAMTTNGVLLAETARDLKAAGLHRINVSIDSLHRCRYESITGVDCMDDVMRGIHEALEAGLSPVKVNAVIIKGVNDPDIELLADLAVQLGIAVRFIEYFPTEKNTEPASRYLPNSIIRKQIEDRFGPMVPVVDGDPAAPAHYFKLAGSDGMIGFISGRSSVFCGSCNRLRLTSDGHVKPCLYSSHSYNMKKLLRDGASDNMLLGLIDRILAEKHDYTRLNSLAHEFTMRNIGG